MQRLRDKRKDLWSSSMSHFLACDDKSCTRLNDLLDRIFLRAKLVMHICNTSLSLFLRKFGTNCSATNYNGFCSRGLTFQNLRKIPKPA